MKKSLDIDILLDLIKTANSKKCKCPHSTSKDKHLGKDCKDFEWRSSKKHRISDESMHNSVKFCRDCCLVIVDVTYLEEILLFAKKWGYNNPTETNSLHSWMNTETTYETSWQKFQDQQKCESQKYFGKLRGKIRDFLLHYL